MALKTWLANPAQLFVCSFRCKKSLGDVESNSHRKRRPRSKSDVVLKSANRTKLIARYGPLPALADLGVSRNTVRP